LVKMRNGKILIYPDELNERIINRLGEFGVKSEHAAIVADTLVEAEMRGTKSHGINMLNAYLERIEQGGLNIEDDPVIIKQNQWMALVDARGGFGQVAGKFAVNLSIQNASERGIFWVGVRNSNHCGALAYYTERIARSGLIAIMFVNANPTVAPFGGMEAVLGTNPISAGIPTENSPIILDMATSSVAKARIYHAKERGEKINPDWALDEEGNPTDDPDKAINGVLTPMAGPKGYGLAIVVDVIAGILNRSGFSHYVNSVHKKTDECQNAGITIISVSIDAFLERETYYAKINELIKFIKTSKPRPDYNIYLPGEIEEHNRQIAKRHGIQIEKNLWERVFKS